MRAFLILVAVLMGSGAWAQELSFAVSGGDRALERKLRNLSLLGGLGAAENTRTQDYFSAARADYRRLLAALYDAGYYGGRVSITLDGREAAGIPALAAPASLDQVAVSVETGRRFVFGQTEVTPQAPGAVAPAEFSPGAPARAKTVRAAAATSIGAWRDLGHAKAQLRQDIITADHRSGTLDAHLAIDPGPRLRFGALRIAGQSAVRPARIRAIAGLPEGKIFSPEQLAMATARLRRTGAFDSVSLTEAETWEPNMALPITATVADRKPRRFGASLEYDTSAGASVSAFWLHRNLLGGAERFRVGGKVSGLSGRRSGPDYALQLSFERPATFAPQNTLRAWAKWRNSDEPGFWIDELDFGLGLRREIGTHFTLSAGLGVVSARARDAQNSRSYTLATLPLTASLDRRDDPHDARSGHYLGLGLTPFAGLHRAPGGLRATADLRGYRSFGARDQVTLAGRLQMGALMGPSVAEAPADYLFFSGGGGTVRGQAYQSLGGSRLNGAAVGGRSFAALSAEARLRLSEKFGVVGFADAGRVGAGSAPWGTADWHSGAGLGLRYDTPLGPLRLDVATPTSGAARLKNTQFYIGIGQSF